MSTHSLIRFDTLDMVAVERVPVVENAAELAAPAGQSVDEIVAEIDPATVATPARLERDLRGIGGELRRDGDDPIDPQIFREIDRGVAAHAPAHRHLVRVGFQVPHRRVERDVDVVVLVPAVVTADDVDRIDAVVE
jgi:hypothetical protein